VQLLVHAGIHSNPSIRPSCFFNVGTLIFLLISAREEKSLPIKHAKNYRINIFDYEGHNP